MSIEALCIIVTALWGAWHSHEPGRMEVRWTRSRLDGYCGIYLHPDADPDAKARMEQYTAMGVDVLYREQNYMLAELARLQGVTVILKENE